MEDRGWEMKDGRRGEQAYSLDATPTHFSHHTKAYRLHPGKCVRRGSRVPRVLFDKSCLGIRFCFLC